MMTSYPTNVIVYLSEDDVLGEEDLRWTSFKLDGIPPKQSKPFGMSSPGPRPAPAGIIFLPW
jgi:hypothetical protein